MEEHTDFASLVDRRLADCVAQKAIDEARRAAEHEAAAVQRQEAQDRALAVADEMQTQRRRNRAVTTDLLLGAVRLLKERECTPHAVFGKWTSQPKLETRTTMFGRAKQVRAGGERVLVGQDGWVFSREQTRHVEYLVGMKGVDAGIRTTYTYHGLAVLADGSVAKWTSANEALGGGAEAEWVDPLDIVQGPDSANDEFADAARDQVAAWVVRLLVGESASPGA